MSRQPREHAVKCRLCRRGGVWATDAYCDLCRRWTKALDIYVDEEHAIQQEEDERVSFAEYRRGGEL